MSGAPVYNLLDQVNAHNTAELARTDLDARALGTLEWVPPSERLIVNEHARGRIQFSSATTRDKWHRSLGYGAVIWCGGIFETPLTAPGSPNEQWTRLQATKRNRNVCRPFDEAHAIRDEIDREWYRLRWCNSLVDENGVPILKPGELDALNSPRDMRPFRATVPKRLDAWIQFATPPNHGHGAKCVCRRDMRYDDFKRARVAGEPIRVISRGGRNKPGSPRLVVRTDCQWCNGTGNVECDDERAGRVSPSHAAGGYEEWLNRDAFERGRTGRMPAFNWPQLSGNSG